jgi:hypothetical protein
MIVKLRKRLIASKWGNLDSLICRISMFIKNYGHVKHKYY